MNYREMLDQFEWLDKKLAHLELENRYLRERLAKVEGQLVSRNVPPGFTPGTLPQYTWQITSKDNTQ